MTTERQENTAGATPEQSTSSVGQAFAGNSEETFLDARAVDFIDASGPVAWLNSTTLVGRQGFGDTSGNNVVTCDLLYGTFGTIISAGLNLPALQLVTAPCGDYVALVSGEPPSSVVILCVRSLAFCALSPGDRAEFLCETDGKLSGPLAPKEILRSPDGKLAVMAVNGKLVAFNVVKSK